MSRAALLMAAAASGRVGSDEAILAVPGSGGADARLLYWEGQTPDDTVSIPGASGEIVIQPGAQVGGRLVLQLTSGAKLWSLGTDRTLTEVEPPEAWPLSGPDRDPGPPISAGFSPDGRWLMMIPWGPTGWFPWVAAMYSVTSAGLVKVDALDGFDAVSPGPFVIQWSPDGTCLTVSGGFPSRVLLFEWDGETLVQTGAVDHEFPGQVAPNSITFSPDGRFAALATQGSRFLTVLDVAQSLSDVPAPLAPSETGPEQTALPAWSPSGRYLAVGAEREVHPSMVDTSDGVTYYVQVIDWQQQQLLVHGAGIADIASPQSIAWHPQRDELIICVDDYFEGVTTYILTPNGSTLELLEVAPNLDIGPARSWSQVASATPPTPRDVPALTFKDFGLSWSGRRFIGSAAPPSGGVYFATGSGEFLVVEDGGEVATLTDFGVESPAINSIALTPGGSIVGLVQASPWQDEGPEFLVADPVGGTASLVGDEQFGSRSRITAGGDGNLWAVWGNEIMRIDPNTFTYSADDYGLNGWYGVWGFAAVGDALIAAPGPGAPSGQGAVIDTASNTATFTAFGVDWDFMRWGTPSAGPDGRAYFPPYFAPSFVVVDAGTQTGAPTNFGRPFGQTMANDEPRMVTGANGRMYWVSSGSAGMPSDVIYLFELEPYAGELSIFAYPVPDNAPGAPNNYVAQAGSDGRIYLAPAGPSPVAGVYIIDVPQGD